MPAWAARVFNVLWIGSGTFLIWIIFAMLKTLSHVPRMRGE